MSLRDEFLRLLREDEVFRLAVIGLLGISDIQSTLRQLVDAVGGLVKNQSAMMETLNKVLETIQRLTENQEKLWEEDNRIWREVNALREVQSKILEENNKIWQEIKKLIENQEKMWQEIRGLRRDVNVIRKTLDNITASIEEEANDVVTHLLRDRGVNLRTDRVTLNLRFEFDVYGTNGQLTIIGEAKSRVGPRLIARFDEKVNRAVALFPSKFPGKVIKVIYCLRAMPGAIEEAERRGIWLIESMRERTRPSF